MFVTLISLLSAVRVLSSTPAPPQKKTDETKLLRGSPRKLVQCGNEKFGRTKPTCHDCMNKDLPPEEKNHKDTKCNGGPTSDCKWVAGVGCIDK